MCCSSWVERANASVGTNIWALEVMLGRWMTEVNANGGEFIWLHVDA